MDFQQRKKEKNAISPSTPVVFMRHQKGPKENGDKKKICLPPSVVVIQVIKQDKLYEILGEKQINAKTTLVKKEDVKINDDNEDHCEN